MPTIRVRRHGTGHGAEDVADPRAVPRPHLLRAGGDGRVRGAGREGVRRLLRVASRPPGGRAGGGRDRDVLQLQPRHRPPRHPLGVGGRLARAAPRGPPLGRRRRAAASARRPGGRPVAGTRRRAGPVRHRGLHGRRAGRSTRPTPACRGPRCRTSFCGMPSRCCASSAATGTSPAWSTPGWRGSTPSSSMPPPVRCRARRCRPRGIGTTPRGRPPSRGWPGAGSSTTRAPSPQAGAALRQHIEDQTDALALAPWATLGVVGCDELRSLVRPLSRAVVESGTFGFR